MGMDPATATIGASVVGGLLNKPSGISAPKPRSYLGEMQSALNAQAGIQDQLIGLERAYTPLWQQQQKEALMGGMNTLNSLYGSALPIAGQLGSQVASAMAPAYAQAGQTAMSAYQSMFSPEAQGIYGLMGQQAKEGLQAGYGLNAQQTQYAQQAARAAMAARGMSTGNQAIAQEVLGSYQLGNQRYQQNLLNAQNYLGTSQNIASQAYNMYGQPLMAQIGQVSPAGLIGNASQMNAGLGAKLFNPESQYNADVMGANQANQMNTTLANQQARAGWGAGMMSMAGQLGGAYLKTLEPSTTGASNVAAMNNFKPVDLSGFGNYSA